LVLSILTKIDHYENIIHDRKVILCPRTADWSVPELFRACPECNEFYFYCCACNQEPLDFPQDRQPAKFCHHLHIAFTDAYTNNGRPGAKVGIGVACGNDDSSQLSKPITDRVDNLPLRSNQRAELCAAKSGLEFFAEASTKDPKREAAALIVATDSEYVVKGMTEWLPKWKVCISVLKRASSDASDRVYRETTGAQPNVLHRKT
jgi:ribonuclease HI